MMLFAFCFYPLPPPPPKSSFIAESISCLLFMHFSVMMIALVFNLIMSDFNNF